MADGWETISSDGWTSLSSDGWENVEKPKGSTSLWEDIKIPFASAANSLDTGVTFAGRGLESIVGKDRSIEDEDALFNEMKRRREQREKWANPNDSQQSFAAKAVGMVATLPAQMVGMAGASAERGMNMVDAGESTNAAQTATLADTALNVGSLALPAGFGATRTSKVLTGAGANVATGAASDAITQAVSSTDTIKKMYDPMNLENRAMEAILGAGFGAIAKTPPKGKVDTKGITGKLDAIDGAKKAAAEEVVRTQELAQGKQGELGLEGPATTIEQIAARRRDPNQGDLLLDEGQMKPVEGADVVRPELTDAQKTLEAQMNDPRAIGKGMDVRELDTSLSDARRNESDTPLRGQRLDVTKLSSWRVLPDGTGTLDVGNILEEYNKHIKKTMDKDATGDLAILMPYIQSLYKKFNNQLGLQVIVHNTNTVKTRNGREAHGFYSHGDHKVVVGQYGLKPGVFLHEIGHAMSVRAIQAYPDHPAVKVIDALYEAYKNDPSLKHKYGTDDVFEFVSESWSSRAFKTALAKLDLPFQGTIQNALKVLMNAYSDLFGLKTNPEKNALAKLMDATDQIVSKYAADPLATNAQYWKNYKEGKTYSQLKEAASLVTKKENRVESLIKAVTDEAAQQEKVMRGIPGLEDIDYIPKDPVVDAALLAKIASEKDGGSFWSMLQPGALLRSQLTDSTMVKTVYRLMSNAEKRSEFYINKLVKPVEEQMASILRSEKQTEIAHGLFMRELKNSKEYTAAELKAAGVPDNIVEAHMAMREMFSKTIDIQNEALLSKGQKPIKPIDAYMSARWQGPWRTVFRDAEGKVIWAVAERTKGKAEKAVEYIKSNSPELKADPVDYKIGREKGDSLNAGYLEMLKLLDPTDPRTAVLESIYKDYITGTTENVVGQEKHFKRKTGARGFAGDRPWAKNDARDMFLEQFQYANNAMKWSETQKPLESVKELLASKEAEAQPNNTAFSREYIKQALGFGTAKSIDAIENSLAKALGKDRLMASNALGIGKSWFYTTKLGLSFPFVVAQLVQPMLVAPARHAKLTALGYDHNPALSMVRGISDGLSFALYHQVADVGGVKNMATKTMTPLGREAAKYAEINGVVDINQFSDIKNLGKPETFVKAKEIVDMSIIEPEKIARSQAFMSYVHHLDQSGKFDTSTKEGRNQLFQIAEEATQSSMTNYNPMERAMAFEKLGLTGNALSTLRTFMMNSVAQLAEYSRDASKGKPQALFYYVLPYLAAGGLGGMFFIEDLDDLLDNIKELLPHDEYMKVKDFSLKSWMLSNLGELATTGLVSKATGTNINTRLSSGNQVPFYPFEQDAPNTLKALFPMGGDLYKQSAGIFAFADPRSTQKEKAVGLYNATPTGFRGILEETNSEFKAGDTSLSVGSGLTRGVYKRTPEESTIRKTGLKSSKEALAMDADYRLFKTEKEMAARQKTASAKALEYLATGDSQKGATQLLRVFELGGNPEAVINQLQPYVINQVTTELERRLIAAGSGQSVAIQRLLRYLETPGAQQPSQQAPQAPQQAPSQLGTPAPQSAAPRASTQAIVSTEELKLLPYHHPKLDKVAFETEKKYKLPTGLLVAIKNAGEKSNSDQESPKGAKGVMQFIDSTREAYPHDPKDPMQSIDASGKYFKDLLKMYRGNVRAVVAHYNGGRKAGLAVLDGEQPPADETRAYLVRVEKHMKDARNGR